MKNRAPRVISGEKDEEQEIIAQQPADNGDELERDGGEAFDEDEGPAPFGVEFAQAVYARAIAVELDDPMAERVEQRAPIA